MTVHGIVKKGKLVLTEPLPFADGTKVVIRASRTRRQAKAPSGAAAFLLKHAGGIEDERTDLSVNHDHYLYGTPKKKK